MKMKVRKLSLEDAEWLYELAMDKSVRRNSIQESKFNFESHVQWLTKKISELGFVIYVFNLTVDIGYVRVQIRDSRAYISIALKESYRGKGHSGEMLKMAMRKYQSDCGVSEFWAVVKDVNSASMRLFEKNGFELQSEEGGLLEYKAVLK